MSPTKILVVPGSLRTGSLNARLASLIARELARPDVEVTLLSLKDYPLPIYDGDLEQESGVPAAAVELKRMIGAHHGVVFVSPEYNSSFPPLVKNTIDWVTRVREDGESLGQVFRERVFAIAAASNGKFGGMRVLMGLRQVLALGCGANVIPKQLALSFAETAYDDNGQLKNPADAAALSAMLGQLVDTAQRMK
ncbi:MAG TPA: NAD(P)H-dependent oxidoreductase [Xanthobacteraceae bacterium]|nr:NAD(P)H-dependent oxidoreductase [Xanthobacteraceae bacterium]